MTIEPTTTLPTITLHSTVYGSDKLYQLTIVPAQEPNTYNLVYANGRRTGTLTPDKAPKNSIPVTLDQATAELENLTRHQTSRGYHELGKCSLCADQQVAVTDLTTAPTCKDVNASCQLLTLLP